jgi:hypothetical protein
MLLTVHPEPQWTNKTMKLKNSQCKNHSKPLCFINTLWMYFLSTKI